MSSHVMRWGLNVRRLNEIIQAAQAKKTLLTFKQIKSQRMHFRAPSQYKNVFNSSSEDRRGGQLRLNNARDMIDE